MGDPSRDTKFRQGPIRSRLGQALLSGYDSDVTFLVSKDGPQGQGSGEQAPPSEPEVIQAHKFLLRLSTPQLAKLIDNHQKDSLIRVNADPKLFRKLLKLIYTDEFDCSGDVAGFFNLAIEFGFPDLSKLLLERFREVDLSPENAVFVLNLGRYLDREGLARRALQYIEDNGDKILQTDFVKDLRRLDLYTVISSDKLKVKGEEVILDAVLKWGQSKLFSRVCIDEEERKALLRHEVGKLNRLYGIRYTFLPYQLLQTKVRDSGLLTHGEIVQMLCTAANPKDNPLELNVTPRDGYKKQVEKKKEPKGKMRKRRPGPEKRRPRSRSRSPVDLPLRRAPPLNAKESTPLTGPPSVPLPLMSLPFSDPSKPQPVPAPSSVSHLMEIAGMAMTTMTEIPTSTHTHQPPASMTMKTDYMPSEGQYPPQHQQEQGATYLEPQGLEGSGYVEEPQVSQYPYQEFQEYQDGTLEGPQIPQQGPEDCSETLEETIFLNCSLHRDFLMEACLFKQATLTSIILRDVELITAGSRPGSRALLPALTSFCFLGDDLPGPSFPSKLFLGGLPLRDFLFFSKQPTRGLLSQLSSLGVDILLRAGGGTHLELSASKFVLSFPTPEEGDFLLENLNKSLVTMGLCGVGVKSPKRIPTNIMNLSLFLVDVKGMGLSDFVREFPSLRTLSLFEAPQEDKTKGVSCFLSFQKHLLPSKWTIQNISLTAVKIECSKDIVAFPLVFQLYLNCCEVDPSFLEEFLPKLFPNLQRLGIRTKGETRLSSRTVKSICDSNSRLQILVLSRYQGCRDPKATSSLISDAGEGIGTNIGGDKKWLRSLLQQSNIGVQSPPDFLLERVAMITPSSEDKSCWTARNNVIELDKIHYDWMGLHDLFSPQILRKMEEDNF